MEIKKIVVGSLEENCYVISIDNECLVIDPGSEFDKIKEAIGNKKVLGILITHEHFDHIGALKDVLDEYDVKVYKFDNLEEKEYNIGPFKFEVIFNPGHTIDSVSYYFKDERKMFTGDFIFLENIGRCDLEGGDFSKMKESIEKLKEIEDDITIYPGHGLKTTLEYEKRFNSYF